MDTVGRRLDRGPGVAALELYGMCQAPQGALKAPRVVDVFDEAGRIRGNILVGLILHEAHGLDLQCLEEALGLPVIVRSNPPAH